MGSRAHCHPDRPSRYKRLCSDCFKERYPEQYSARRDKLNKKSRQRYATDVRYRKEKIAKATKTQKTKRGRVQSRLRIINHEARKCGYAECHTPLETVMSAFTGRCRLCDKTDKSLVIDHDHVTGEFRAWLCANCNSGLGFFNDNIDSLRKAADYLEARSTNSTKDTNPKDALGVNKAPIHLWPRTATALGSYGLLDGALKYGKNNWRFAGIRASVYIDALLRHVYKWWEGEDIDPDSGLPHEAHMLATLAILVDAKAAGKMTDDRVFPRVPFSEILEELEPHVKRLREKYKDKHPQHYTVSDLENICLVG